MAGESVFANLAADDRVVFFVEVPDEIETDGLEVAGIVFLAADLDDDVDVDEEFVFDVEGEIRLPVVALVAASSANVASVLAACVAIILVSFNSPGTSALAAVVRSD